MSVKHTFWHTVTKLCPRCSCCCCCYGGGGLLLAVLVLCCNSWGRCCLCRCCCCYVMISLIPLSCPPKTLTWVTDSLQWRLTEARLPPLSSWKTHLGFFFEQLREEGNRESSKNRISMLTNLKGRGLGNKTKGHGKSKAKKKKAIVTKFQTSCKNDARFSASNLSFGEACWRSWRNDVISP